MTNRTASTLDSLTYIIDADGVAHGDLFCASAPTDGTGTWVTLPAGEVPESGCSCAADALPPLNTGRFLNVDGPSQDAPDFTGTGTGRSAEVRPMTEKQEAFITRLLGETGADPEAVGFRSDIGSKAASAVIDKLLGLKDHVPAPAAVEATASEGFDFAAAAEALGRKFTADDLTADLRAYAMTYALGYDGDFSFMVDMRDAARRGRLSDGMAKGVLNCARADLSRKATTTEAPAADVPAGRYAYTGTEGHTVFVKIDRPERGRWAGYTFGSFLLGGGAGGELVEGARVGREQMAGVLARITEQGITESGIRFGQETGVCCRCGRGLTNEESREAGIGPECAKKG